MQKVPFAGPFCLGGLDGIWMKSQIVLRRIATIVLFCLAAWTPTSAAQSSLAGDWRGDWNISGGQLRFVLHIKSAQDGSLSATLDSLDQGMMGVPVTIIVLKDAHLTFTIASSHIRYEGIVNAEETKIRGTLTQTIPLRLTFKRQEPIRASGH
jgi:hypothetical protein